MIGNASNKGNAMEFNEEDLMKRLSPGGQYTEAQQAVRAWVYKNRQMFIDQDWTLPEVAEMARTVEIADAMSITVVLSHFKDALNGSHIENRFAMMDYNFDCAVKRFQEMDAKLKKPFDLMPLWEDLVNQYERGSK